MTLNKTKLLLVALISSTGIFGQTTFNYTGSMQQYTVPAGVSFIKIETFGAQGGNGDAGIGGNGATMTGDFTVVPGQVIDILVGGQPSTGNGGGGGTFVVDNATGDPIIVAGGGGGGAGSCCGTVHDGAPGVSTINGTDGINASGGTGTGGVGGDGGALGANGQCGGAGGGFYTDGADGYNGSTGGMAYVNGGGPGAYEGGYGGGGGSHCAGVACAGGGGGGYSGGGSTGGGGQWGGGGGGGSFNAGINQVNADGANVGNGYVVITELCDGLTNTVSATMVCPGDFVTLSASSTNGGNVTWDNGITDNTPFLLTTPGTYTYTATSDNATDCQFVVDITVQVAPEFSLTTQDDFGNNDGGVYMTIIDGLFPFTFDWDNDGTGDFDDTQNITNLGPGTYNVVVSHGNGCTTEDGVTVISQLGINTNEINFSVYPNPTSGNLSINYQGSFNFELTNALGEVIYAGNGTNKADIDLSTFADGLYFVTLFTEENSSTIQVVKQ